MTAKQFVIDAVREMPDGLSLDELLTELSILTALRRSQAEIEVGDSIEHEDLKRETATWHSE